MDMGHIRCSNDEIDENLKAGEQRDACSVCGNLCNKRFSRCKAARYCSGLCQIKHWRSGHKDECIEKKNIEDQEIRTAHETSEFNLLNKNKMGDVAHERPKEPVKYPKEEQAEMKRNIQERRRIETKQSAIKKVEEIGRDLATARDDLASAISRAEVAEAKLSILEDKIKMTDDKHLCTICLDKEKDMAFRCGHMTCRDCGSKIPICPICREQINIRVRLFHG